MGENAPTYASFHRLFTPSKGHTANDFAARSPAWGASDQSRAPIPMSVLEADTIRPGRSASLRILCLE